MKSLFIITALAASICIARGELFAFSAITSNDSGGLAQAAGEAQLYMDVTSLDTDQISLVFTNAGPVACFISSVYFDFIPELNLELESINNGPGVEFVLQSKKPKNLPAGNTLDNPFISDLTVSARTPISQKSINPYEGLELLMSFDPSFNLLDALADQDLRIGLHVQGFAGGYSESFINETSHTDTIPEPGTLPIMIVAGLILRRIRYWSI